MAAFYFFTTDPQWHSLHLVDYLEDVTPLIPSDSAVPPEVFKKMRVLPSELFYLLILIIL